MARRSTIDWILEAVSLTILVAIFGIIVGQWTDLPGQVPVHFGFSGAPDRWGNKNELLLLPAAAAGLYILLTLASHYQRLINIPFAINRAAPEVQSLLLSMSVMLKTILLLVFLYLVRVSVDTALGRSAGLGKQFLPVFLILIFLTLAAYLVKLRRYRP